MRGWPFLASLVAVLLGSSGIASAQDKPLICDQQFALCTSANCIPAPGNPKVALCTCDVWDTKGGTIGGCLVRRRQAEHRRQWLAHRLFLFLAHAILSGQTLDEMPGRNAVGGVPQREVHCRPCRSVKSNLCLRNYGPNRRMGHVGGQLQHAELQ